MGGGEIRLVGLVKRFEDVTAVGGIDLDVAGGEFFALLGPRAAARRRPCGWWPGSSSPPTAASCSTGSTWPAPLEEYGSSGPNRVPGMVERLVYQGPATQLVIRLANGESLQALVQNQGQPLTWRQGTAIAVHLPADALRVLAASSAQGPLEAGAVDGGSHPTS